MAGQRIATTTQAGLHSVGTAGQPVNMAYEQIVRYLTQSLGPEHAHVLAEPNYNPTRGTVDWYTPLDGPVRRLADLSEEERPQVEGRLAELRDGIAGAAARLGASDHGGDRMLGKMIGLSLEIPGEDHIYIVGDQPVLTCWGMVQDSPAPERGVLRKFIPWGPALGMRGGALAISRVMMVEPLMWLAWLLWLLFGALLAVIFIILLSGCGVRVPGFEWLAESGWANYCPVTRTAEDLNRPDPQLMAERARQSVLEAELSRLELEVAVAVRACRRAEGRPVPAVPIDRTPLPTGPVTVPPATVPPATNAPDAPATEVPDRPAAPVVPAPVDTGEAVDVEDPPAAAAIDVDPDVPVNRSTGPGTVGTVDDPPDAEVPHLPVSPPDAEEPVDQADVPHLPVDPPAAEEPVEQADVPRLPVDPPDAEEPVDQADVPHLPVSPPDAVDPVDQADVPHLPVDPPDAEEPVDQADVPHLPVDEPEDMAQAEEPVDQADVPHLPVDPPDEVAAADQAEEPVAEPPPLPDTPEPSLDPAPEPEPPAEEPAPEDTADQAPPPSPQEQPSATEEEPQEPSPEELAANAALAIELDWESEDDLNLHVVCPDGSRIYSLSRQGCGGRLLGDANASGDVEPSASETVAFQEAPDGPLRIEVDNFNARSPGDPPVPFQIRIRRPDGSVEVVEGNVASGDGRVLVREIDVP